MERVVPNTLGRTTPFLAAKEPKDHKANTAAFFEFGVLNDEVAGVARERPVVQFTPRAGAARNHIGDTNNMVDHRVTLFVQASRAGRDRCPQRPDVRAAFLTAKIPATAKYLGFKNSPTCGSSFYSLPRPVTPILP